MNRALAIGQIIMCFGLLVGTVASQPGLATIVGGSFVLLAGVSAVRLWAAR